MLKYFQDRREQKQLLAAFKERAAVQCWTLLEILKRNDGTLVSSSQWLD
ncbi:hypothetical protein PCA31118_05077 [Pandoraea captiosa]|uniref:Uncharacterized protein n=1 Tax=Pandoraea captiosa TaxID=2508302 RepID=A0A5E5AR11_9BURK|nr:hypothetical protein PCA31118_05077 [Pandoraea captiosa]